jgi:tRNA-splicing ligase RtcB
MRVLQGDNGRFAKVWVDELYNVESQTLDQIRLMLKFPALFKHVAVMPDCHLGKGAVVGGVVATKGCVVPNIVGVDIGCGMASAYTGYTYREYLTTREFWEEWASRVRRDVPTGFNQHTTEQWLPSSVGHSLCADELQDLVFSKSVFQVGTLGGGNHFIEAQVDEDNTIWLTVHSGSRHTGLKIANYYERLAKDLNRSWHSQTPDGLWFLPQETSLFQDYMSDMQWAVRYADHNRTVILTKMVVAFIETVADHTGEDPDTLCANQRTIHCAHNFARFENHFGENVVVHRKGATSAKEGEIGVIPGSMGTNTYIVRGLGNPESYMSCSHGAGRTMSRSQAKKQITPADMKEQLAGTFTQHDVRLIDEAPAAYKDIDLVMANQVDLVEIVHTLHPIITIKGEGD